MKKFILAAVGASLLSAPVFAAPFQSHGPNDRGRIEQNHRPDVRRGNYRPAKIQIHQSWKRGDRFDARRAYNYRVIGNPRGYRLNAAPRGYRWVQSGNDAVLVGIASGIIASVMANAIR
jgi:Ni/Co efflux regulator RcnB